MFVFVHSDLSFLCVFVFVVLVGIGVFFCRIPPLPTSSRFPEATKSRDDPSRGSRRVEGVEIIMFGKGMNQTGG